MDFITTTFMVGSQQRKIFYFAVKITDLKVFFFTFTKFGINYLIISNDETINC